MQIRICNYKQLMIITIIALSATLLSIIPARSQVEGPIPQELRWIAVSDLHQWFSNAGAEIEYGRRGRTFETTDQLDGLRWPGDFLITDHLVGKSMWIGTTNFLDPVTNITYPYKVICAGRLAMYIGLDLFPETFKMIGHFHHPVVTVDGESASDLDLFDEVDDVDESQAADRIIYNTLHTPIGITVKRKILAFSQQYHNNYFIYEYVFKNTGIINNTGGMIQRTLTGVVFHFQDRYACAGEAYKEQWSFTGASWGRNAMNDVVGTDPTAPDFDLRAVYTWYGPHSSAPGGTEDDVGGPDHTNGTSMTGASYVGMAVLHADKSSVDKSDDLYQPTTTHYMGSDGDAQTVTEGTQYNSDSMTRKYGFMTRGHAAQTHAELVGDGYANIWGVDEGGYASAQGFGPYTMNTGDSIRVVLVEAVAGIDRRKNYEVTYNWFNDLSPFTLPDGSNSNNRNDYKNAWVRSGDDSLFQTFRRARQNFQNNYNIPLPPPPPENFTVTSGGDRISITWTGVAAEAWPNFDGYILYRGVGKPDTLYTEIFSCDRDNVANSFDDYTARRGLDYYYYIVSKDDGSTNDIESNTPLISSKYYTKTNQPASLLRQPGKSLEQIRVVPNPYHIKAQGRLQFGVQNPDRIAFFDLPPFCTIKIYTERGDLIKTITHDNGSGDEYWNSVTSANQVVVSGIYIAYIEIDRDVKDETTGQFTYRKGDNTFRKILIVR